MMYFNFSSRNVAVVEFIMQRIGMNTRRGILMYVSIARNTIKDWVVYYILMKINHLHLWYEYFMKLITFSLLQPTYSPRAKKRMCCSLYFQPNEHITLAHTPCDHRFQYCRNCALRNQTCNDDSNPLTSESKSELLELLELKL